MKKVFAVLAVLFAVFVLAVIFGGGDDSKPNLSDNSQAQAKPESVEPPVVVAAKDLVKDYESNEVAADQKYKGKILEVSGKVAGIDSGIGDDVLGLLSAKECQLNNKIKTPLRF